MYLYEYIIIIVNLLTGEEYLNQMAHNGLKNKFLSTSMFELVPLNVCHFHVRHHWSFPQN